MINNSTTLEVGIYKITSPSGKVYIGQSRDINKRWTQYVSLNCKGQKRLYKSFNKYGASEHSFEIVEICLFEELNDRERHWQDHYSVTGKEGLNGCLVDTSTLPRVYSQEVKDKIRQSKLGKKQSEETRKKITEARKGKYIGESAPNFGNKHSAETKSKMSKAHKGKYSKENSPNFGKSRSEETKEKIRKAATGRKHSESTKALLRKRQANRENPQARRVIDTETNEVFKSIGLAAKSKLIPTSTLTGKLNGFRTNDTTFKYYEQ